MKKGIDKKALVSHKDPLGKMLDLDSRGGFFGQTEMETAFREHAEKIEHTAHFEAIVARSKWRDFTHGVTM